VNVPRSVVVSVLTEQVSVDVMTVETVWVGPWLV
jgi:hypothetical protein